MIGQCPAGGQDRHRAGARPWRRRPHPELPENDERPDRRAAAGRAASRTVQSPGHRFRDPRRARTRRDRRPGRSTGGRRRHCRTIAMAELSGRRSRCTRSTGRGAHGAEVRTVPVRSPAARPPHPVWQWPLRSPPGWRSGRRARCAGLPASSTSAEQVGGSSSDELLAGGSDGRAGTPAAPALSATRRPRRCSAAAGPALTRRRCRRTGPRARRSRSRGCGRVGVLGERPPGSPGAVALRPGLPPTSSSRRARGRSTRRTSQRPR
ncbi:hypothetical protein HBB16_01365 [Pseudonocardia sp. MCCB 268]|nr:hypothetical protein [Pseudonocardia cytotoxica]